MKINYRLMSIADHEEIIKLWKVTPGIGVSKSDQKDKLEFFLNKNSTTCFVAQDQENIIGTVLCGNDGRRGYLFHLTVKEDYRNKGIGRELIKLCFDGLKKAGMHLCHLFVFKTNETAINFYKKTSWKEREEIIVFSKDV